MSLASTSEVRCGTCNQPMRPSSAVQGLLWCVPCGSVLRTERAEAEEPPRARSRTQLMREMETAVLLRRVREALDEAKSRSAPWQIINPLVSAAGVLACATEIDRDSARRVAIQHARRALEMWSRWRSSG